MRASDPIRVSNVEPRRDTRGQIVDAHDGCLERFGDRYYLYGTAYGNTSGFTGANEYCCYSSPDLATWTFHGALLPGKPAGVYYRPHVKFCRSSGLYILWYNWYPTLWDGQYGVAVSERPEGPFRIVHAQALVSRRLPGDHGLFVDDDGVAYLIYTSIAEGHSISIERLGPDYLSSSGVSSGVLSTGDEACTLFKRQGRYYALFDSCCCFCPGGSGAKVYVASSPLGPYTFVSNINREAPGDSHGRVIVAAQQAHVAAVEVAGRVEHIWIGDRWGSAPDGRKGHDFQFWSAPLQFNSDASIAPLAWVDAWEIRGGGVGYTGDAK